eukprot:6191833-Pleurochrysis_carterae.AAC.3
MSRESRVPLTSSLDVTRKEHLRRCRRLSPQALCAWQRDVECLAPRLQITDRGIRPHVGKWNETLFVRRGKACVGWPNRLAFGRTEVAFASLRVARCRRKIGRLPSTVGSPPARLCTPRSPAHARPGQLTLPALTAHAEGVADFDGSRAGVACKQNASDGCIQLVIGCRVRTSKICTIARALSLRVAVVRGLASFRTVPVPVCASAVPALGEAGVPRSEGGLALLVASVSRRIGTFRSIALRRSRFVALRLIRSFRNECTALRLIEFDVAANFACLTVAEHFSNGDERKRQAAHRALHDKFHVEDGVDTRADSTHNGTQLFSDQSIAESSMSGKRPIEPRECVVQAIEFSKRRL